MQNDQSGHGTPDEHHLHAENRPGPACYARALMACQAQMAYALAAERPPVSPWVRAFAPVGAAMDADIEHHKAVATWQICLERHGDVLDPRSSPAPAWYLLDWLTCAEPVQETPAPDAALVRACLEARGDQVPWSTGLRSMHGPSFGHSPTGGASMWQEFKAFIMRGSVVDLAVGIIIGGAFGRIVSSLVTDMLMPPIRLLLGRVDFSNLFLNLSGPPYATLAEAKAAGAATINYGLFLNTVIEFLIVALAVFLLIRLLNRLYQAPLATPTTKAYPYCIAVIPLAASRCPQCTSDLWAA